MRGRVLVIDDEAEIRRGLTFGLTAEDYTVTACPDGISAIHELEGARARGVGYDYLVTDIFMPDIDGLKILKVIKGQFPDLPVVVITGFGDESLRFTALSEPLVGYLEKPFEIGELVKALEALPVGESTLDRRVPLEEETVRESVSAYMAIRLVEPERSVEIFNQLSQMDGIESCDAVRGDMDIIVLGQASSEEGIQVLFDRVRAIPGVVVTSMSRIEAPRLDRDITEFIGMYQKVIKQAGVVGRHHPGAMSYLIVDIDPGSVQQIFTTIFFIDEVVLCDVIDDGTKLVGMVTGQGAVGRAPRIVEKISQIEGVLRVRIAHVIRMQES